MVATRGPAKRHAQTQAQTDTALPQFVKDEFDAYLKCGILAHGFLRLRCAACAHEKRVAFSCKRHGFCPSCGARRMAETAAHPVDYVIPRVPVRQWALSFPIPLRIRLAGHPELLSPVLQIVHRIVATFLIKAAGDCSHPRPSGPAWTGERPCLPSSSGTAACARVPR